ncbi:MAG: P1 family peptidase, partial [Firmicutes bacterium]|nr:P1 family peptidase [Bacillota bacterium]
ALGDVFDWKSGEQIAGLLNEDRTELRSTSEVMKSSLDVVENRFVGNTTLGIVITNGHFEKAQLCKIAGMAHDGYARSIRPVHTSADGDSIYAVSVGDVTVDQDVAGILAAEVISEAINRAVYSADSAYGYISATEFEDRR